MKRNKLIIGSIVILGLLAGSKAHAMENMWKLFGGDASKNDSIIYKSTATKESAPGKEAIVAKQAIGKEAAGKEAIVEKQAQEVTAEKAVEKVEVAEVEKPTSTLMVKDEKTGGAIICTKDMIEAKEGMTAEAEQCLLAIRNIVAIDDAASNDGTVVERDAICTDKQGNRWRVRDTNCMAHPCKDGESCGSRPSDWR